YAYAWDWSTAPLTCTLFCNAGKHVAWHASPPSLKKDTDMQTSLRKLAPALAVMSLVLAGCQTAPKKDADAAAQPQPQATQQATVSVVEFYVAQAQGGPGLMEVKVPDGSLFMQRQPVLTRADLTEAAALVDREGQNFVGLRFTEEGARKLNDVSSQNIGNMLALVIDRELVAAPRIAEPLNR